MINESRKAIREYRCDTCGRSISEGSSYIKYNIRAVVINGKPLKLFDNIHKDCKLHERNVELPLGFNNNWRERAKSRELPRLYYKGITE
jgi:hypothetical protein